MRFIMKATTYTWDENSIYQQYLKDVSKYPLLTKAEERELIRLAHNGNQKAITKLVVSNLKFVINIAFMYKNQGMGVNELINEGNIGLHEAAKRFDPNQNIKFISYAVWWIRQAITRAIAEKARVVRISAEKELVLRRLNRKSRNTRQTIGGEFVIDSEDVSQNTEYNADKVEEIMKMGLRHASLDAPIGDENDGTLMDIATKSDLLADDVASDKSNKSYIKDCMGKLPEQEREVLGMYFGVEREFSLNLLEIGKRIGLSKERVRQVKEKGLARLRDMGMRKEFQDFAYAA
jgi:RNA polymerase primary sigma factor